MRTPPARLVRLAAPLALASGLLLAGCSDGAESDGGDSGGSGGTSVIAPVVMSATDLSGQTVDLVPGQVLDITTGEDPVGTYTGEVAEPSVAEFTAGREDGGATYNPGVTALEVGRTDVTLTGGAEEITFTVEVVGD